ncbi:hypothetical protein C4F40_04975 [Sphingobacterium sp. Ka21]|uniref:Uncharacterized protein n=1 Tax=Sphingobacterium pedocola TaxID=2082722 RepID=A0ABR9T422_9SPHI|nr:hypothetical protein [Sphingobacterium pedocola]
MRILIGILLMLKEGLIYTVCRSPRRGFHFFLIKNETKNQDWVNVTLKALGFTKQLQAVALRGSVLNPNPKAFLTLHRPRPSF